MEYLVEGGGETIEASRFFPGWRKIGGKARADRREFTIKSKPMPGSIKPGVGLMEEGGWRGRSSLFNLRRIIDY